MVRITKTICRRGETAGAIAFGTTRKMCNEELSPINETLMQQMARLWLKFSLTRSKRCRRGQSTLE